MWGDSSLDRTNLQDVQEATVLAFLVFQFSLETQAVRVDESGYDVSELSRFVFGINFREVA